jgi:chemotaxis protein methyltransferase CheR
MDRSTFQRLRDLAYDKAGIDLGAGKETLVAARVAKRVRALGLQDERGYAELIAADESGAELVQFLDAISTNFTSFFREPDHFDGLKTLVRAKAATGQRRFRFWSAACSSGEEPYTMAMTLAEVLDGAVDWRILATDISTRVLATASEGAYREEQVRTVPAPLRSRYFQHRHGVPAEEDLYRISPALKERISFRRMNLSAPPLPMKGPLDAVFCRNVMIYFDTRVRQGLISEIERMLCPGGLLYISHTETLTGVHSGLVLISPSVYRKPGGPE